MEKVFTRFQLWRICWTHLFFQIYPVSILLLYSYPCRVKSALVLVVVVVVVVQKGLGSSRAQLRGEQRHRVEFWSVSGWRGDFGRYGKCMVV